VSSLFSWFPPLTGVVVGAVKLETSLESGNLVEFCSSKLASLQPGSQEARLWAFIAASFR
jgi:hypothetical protein